MDDIENLLQELAKAKELLGPLENDAVLINAEDRLLRDNFAKAQQELEARRREIYLKKQNAAILVQQAESKIQAAKMAKAKEEAEAAKLKAEKERLERDAAMYSTLGKRFDDASMTAPWREWAKDHQIEAGRKIAVDRNVILADVMGLGKTLSSIILADMAEKGTRDVNPDFPLLGDEVNQHIPPMDVWTELALPAFHAKEYPFEEPSGLRDRIRIIPGLTPFDEDQVTINSRPLKAGEQIPFLGYDTTARLINKGFVRRTESQVKKVIVNSIERPVGRRVLYFCPAALLRNVQEEWNRWSPHRNVTYIGAMTRAERNFALSFLPKLDDYVIIVNYEAWRRDKNLLDVLADCKFDTFIIDEAHNIKDMKSVGYKGVRQLLDDCNPEYIIPMTGTPILNRPQEFFTLMTLVNKKEFPPTPQGERDFLWKYCEEYYVEGSSTPRYRFKEGGLDALIKKVSKNIMRRTKEQAGIELPDKTIIRHDLDRDDENYPLQAQAREHMKKFATIVLNKDEGKAISATVIIALITRLRQIETWPAGVKSTVTYTDKVTGEEKSELVQLDVEESQKVDYVIRHDNETGEWEGLIPNVIEDERIIVFSQFKAPLHELKKRIEAMGRTAVIMDGDTTSDTKDQIRHDFDRSKTPDRADSKWDVVLCNYKAGGVGLNFTAATSMIILDSEWNPGKREQAYDRFHRMGQTEKVTINVLSVKNTIDDWLENTIMKEKEKVVDGFEGAVMSAGDLMSAIESGLI